MEKGPGNLGGRERIPSALKRLLAAGALGGGLILPAQSAGCDGVQAETRNKVHSSYTDANRADATNDANDSDLNGISAPPSLDELRMNLEVTANRTNEGISVRLNGPGPADLLVVLDNNITQVRFEGGTIYQVLPDSAASMVTILDEQSGQPVKTVEVSNSLTQ